MPAENQLPTDRPVALRKQSRTNHRQILPASQASPGPILLVFVSHFCQYSIVSRALCVLSHSCMHVCTFSRFSRVLLFATLRTVALHSPLSKGFFRKAQLCPTLCDTLDCSPPSSTVHGILQARILKQVTISFSRDLPDPGIETASPAMANGFFTTQPPGQPLCITEQVNKGLYCFVFLMNSLGTQDYKYRILLRYTHRMFI